MSKSALASITATYTDSENEDDHMDGDSPDSQDSQASQVIIPKQPTPEKAAPEKITLKTTKKEKKRSKKKSVRRLVSYQDDTVISDEGEAEIESESSEESESESDSESESNKKNSITQNDGSMPMEVDDDEAKANSSATNLQGASRSEKSSKYAHYSFNLPPEPKGKPTPELIDKIRNLYDKMETNNMDMNRIIQGRKEFRNPSIYEKLIQFCDINEFGTNYPPEIYDPLQWGAESYYEELSRAQKNDMVKRQKERKDMDKIEQATALARKVEEDAKKKEIKMGPASFYKASYTTSSYHNRYRNKGNGDICIWFTA